MADKEPIDVFEDWRKVRGKRTSSDADEDVLARCAEACAKHGEWKKALDAADRARVWKVERLDIYKNLLRACERDAQDRVAVKILEKLKMVTQNTEIKIDVDTYRIAFSIIREARKLLPRRKSSYLRQPVDDAELNKLMEEMWDEVYFKVEVLSAKAVNEALLVTAEMGNLAVVLAICNEMWEKDLEQDLGTFKAILLACGHAKKPDEAKVILQTALSVFSQKAERAAIYQEARYADFSFGDGLLAPPRRSFINVHNMNDDLAKMAVRIFVEEVTATKVLPRPPQRELRIRFTDGPAGPWSRETAKQKARREMLSRLLLKEYKLGCELAPDGEIRITRSNFWERLGTAKIKHDRERDLERTRFNPGCSDELGHGALCFCRMDHEQRLSESVNQLMDRIPGLAIGEMQVQEECQIFRSDIGKLSEEILRIDESLRHIMPWVDWLRDNQPAMDSLQTYVSKFNSENIYSNVRTLGLGVRTESIRSQTNYRERASSTGPIVVNCCLKPYVLFLPQELDAVRVRLKRIEVNQVQEQKNQKVWQENFSKCRKACEDIYAKCHQDLPPSPHVEALHLDSVRRFEMERRSQQSSEEHRYMKDCEDQYSKWRESAADAIVTCTAQQLAVWDAKSHERQRGVRGKGFWQALTYASHSQSAIMGGRDGTVVVWDICTGEAKQELCCGSAISSLDYAESLKAVFSGEENGTVILWDLCRGLQLSVVWCDAAVNCLAYWFIAPYIRDIPHLHNGEMMQKLIPATPRGTMGRTFLTGDTAFKARWGRFVLKDPEKRVRLFSEHWSRVSSKTISNPQRVEVVRLPGSHGCGNISRPLPVFPAGLLQMREMGDLGFNCGRWLTNFILIDLSIGQALLVGTGVELVTPDSSLGSFKDDGSNEVQSGIQMLPLKPQPQGAREASTGVVQRRGCTDPACVLLFFGHVAVFWFLAVQAEILDKLALQAICSDTIRSSLTDAERASCTSSGSLNGVSGTISQLEQSMTDPTQALQLAGGIPTPTSVMAEVSKYLTPVCTSSCSPPTSRTYDYSPPPDAPWASAYQRLSSRLPRLQLNAWDEASCPYNARYCVPFPGISLQAGPAHLCLPQLNNSLVTQLGSVNLNNAAGSILNSLDSLGVVAFLALILGHSICEIVRKPNVWLSILLIFLLFLAGGAVALLKSIQCAEASLLDSTGQVLNVVENATGLGDTFAAPSLTCEPFGYAISNQDLRTVLRIVGYVLLGFAVLWMLLVICLRSRIRISFPFGPQVSRPLEELLLMISQKLDNFPVKYLKLPLESASSSSILTWKDGEQSLEALGLHDGLELLCVKSSPMASAVPAAPSDASALKAVVFESEERKELETVSMYLELQAEGWKELSWCGPVQIMLQASVAEVILDAQQLLMNLAREAPDSTMPMNSFPKLSMRLNSLLLMQYSIYRWHPCERIQLGFSCGPTLNEKFSTPLSELRFPSGSSLQDGDCLCLFSQMD
eukprot:g30022.t1